MKYILQPIAVLTVLLCLSSVAAHGDQEPLPVPEYNKEGTAEDFMGVWQGKWDDRWGVRLTITLPANGIVENDQGQALNVLYEWEERMGQPWNQSTGKGYLKEGVFRFGKIELYLHPDDRDQAHVIGRFKRQRSAAMKRKEEVKAASSNSVTSQGEL